MEGSALERKDGHKQETWILRLALVTQAERAVAALCFGAGLSVSVELAFSSQGDG